jgi:hypothetical protein
MNKINNYWIPIYIKKLSLFLFILASVIFITYSIGNFQEFLDSTQLVLLNTFGLISLFFIIITLYNIFFVIMDIIKFKSGKYISLGLLIIGEIIIIFLYIFVKIITTVTLSVN